MLLAAVVAQPLPICGTPDRDGWNGPFTALSCSVCCGCAGDLVLEWELRVDGGTYAPALARGDAGSLYIGDVLRGLDHGQTYCLRARLVDELTGIGAWGPAGGPVCSLPSEVCFTWDAIAPSSPNVLDAGVSNAVFSAQLGPIADVGGGVAGYLVYVDGAASVEVGVITSQPLTHALGPGTWAVQLQAVDRADNRSSLSAAVNVTVPVSLNIAVPPAPVWDAPITNSQYFSARWSGPPNALWAVQHQRDDGGWRVASRPVVTDRLAFLDVGGPCTRTRLRTSRLLDGGASDWSPASGELLTDRVAPTLTVATVTVADGGVLISWAPAVDSCPSGLRYEVERLELGDGSRATFSTTGLEFFDAPPNGTVRYRVTATDDAGNRGVSSFSSPVVWPPDAGVAIVDAGAPDAGALDAGADDAGVPDAGAPDAGPDDAGVADAGAPDAGAPDADGGLSNRSLRVGCGCSTGDWPAMLFALMLLARRHLSTATRAERSC